MKPKGQLGKRAVGNSVWVMNSEAIKFSSFTAFKNLPWLRIMKNGMLAFSHEAAVKSRFVRTIVIEYNWCQSRCLKSLVISCNLSCLGFVVSSFIRNLISLSPVSFAIITTYNNRTKGEARVELLDLTAGFLVSFSDRLVDVSLSSTRLEIKSTFSTGSMFFVAERLMLSKNMKFIKMIRRWWLVQ